MIATIRLWRQTHLEGRDGECERRSIFGCCTVDHCRSQEVVNLNSALLQQFTCKLGSVLRLLSFGSCLSSRCHPLHQSTCAQCESDCSPGTCIALHELCALANEARKCQERDPKPDCSTRDGAITSWQGATCGRKAGKDRSDSRCGMFLF